jgi:hypothetical protein
MVGGTIVGKVGSGIEAAPTGAGGGGLTATRRLADRSSSRAGVRLRLRLRLGVRLLSRPLLVPRPERGFLSLDDQEPLRLRLGVRVGLRLHDSRRPRRPGGGEGNLPVNGCVIRPGGPPPRPPCRIGPLSFVRSNFNVRPKKAQCCCVSRSSRLTSKRTHPQPRQAPSWFLASRRLENPLKVLKKRVTPISVADSGKPFT